MLSPVAEEYREFVSSRLFDPHIDVANVLLAAIVKKLLNGGWRSDDVLYHHHPHGDREGVRPSVLRYCEHFPVDALVPCRHPRLRRGRWCDIRSSLHWITRLFAICAIDKYVLPVFLRQLGDASKLVTEVDFPPSIVRLFGEGEVLGPLGVLDLETDHCNVSDMVQVDRPQLFIGMLAGKQAELNRKQRVGALELVDSDPCGTLLVMTEPLRPSFELLTGLLDMSSKAWDMRQIAKLRRGGAMLNQDVPMCIGQLNSAFLFCDIERLMLGPMQFPKELAISALQLIYFKQLVRARRCVSCFDSSATFGVSRGIVPIVVARCGRGIDQCNCR